MDISFLINCSKNYIDDLYENFQRDPQSVNESWKNFFQNPEFYHTPSPVFQKLPARHAHNQTTLTISQQTLDKIQKELAVQKLIDHYREQGHLSSQTNPIPLPDGQKKERDDLLDLTQFSLTEEDLDQNFQICASFGVNNLREAIDHLQSTYCGSLGFEYSYITDPKKRQWLQDKIETLARSIHYSDEKKKRIYFKLNKASLFEKFLGNKYIGQKRFSLEGGENTIVGVDAIINEAAQHEVNELVIGMAHRGRLNILSNIMGKSYEYIFSEFEGMEEARKVTSNGDGDVKYHLGFKTITTTPSKNDIILKLMPNPSHLEAVTPVVEGYTRAKSDATIVGGKFCHPDKVLPLIIHGDAAIAGQGIVYETAQMSKLQGYSAGGTIHFVINNQIGFTTEIEDARSSKYCTDIAKVTDSPVIHVNGDDAEAVSYAAELAVQYRQTFGEDIYIDMLCYRKYGHNESDEPKYTQPALYQTLQNHSEALETYKQKLIGEKILNQDGIKKDQEKFKSELQNRLDKVRNGQVELKGEKPDEEWVSFRTCQPKDFEQSPDTSVKKSRLEKIQKAITTIPENINPIKKSLKIINDRKEKWEKDHIDWALAELYAYGSLLQEGHDIRLSGQDCIRGTFSHRHAAIFDQETSEKYVGLNKIEPSQGRMDIHNSPLSEYAIMGFEYGYSLARPEALTIWEAQFGDFFNTAQTIVDQFICSAKSKWNIDNGIMLFLPHGYEGQGPEHSSARPERFLHICAEFNMVVANCTTPANFFHIIRRQLQYDFRIPTIVLTPKSLLRHPRCISQKSELTSSRFQEYIDDQFCEDKSKVKKVLLCTGKIFYNLQEKQLQDNRQDIAIIRLEQLHPLPFEKIQATFAQYKNSNIYWVQEEPKNMGYWNYITRKFNIALSNVISRKSSASPATGYMSLHLEEQKKIVREAFS